MVLGGHPGNEVARFAAGSLQRELLNIVNGLRCQLSAENRPHVASRVDEGRMEGKVDADRCALHSDGLSCLE
jgi:hypothetical protein